jgi:RNA methyltransferase, TrmH family
MEGGMYKRITSSQNIKIKQLVRLKERKERDKTPFFLIEGYRELRRAVDGGLKFQSLFIAPDLFLGSSEKTLIEQIRAETFLLPSDLFKKISYRDRPDGLMAVAYQMGLGLYDLPYNDKKMSVYVVAEAIEKPGNLGTILRSADGVGADGVIICDRCTDIYNPNVVRASVGTLFTIPVVESVGVEAYEWLKNRKIAIIAATPSAKLEYTEAPLSGSIAIVVGTEQFGLSPLWMDGADVRVTIPMNGVADSLNVAMATTLILYESLRQRKNSLL